MQKIQKKQRLMIIIGLLILILVAILFLQSKNQTDIIQEETIIMEPSEYLLEDAFPAETLEEINKEKPTLDQITRLKNISPVATPDFSIEYSYKTAGFVVKSAQSRSATEKTLKIWLNENGFGDIPDTRFEYQSSKLAL